MPMDTYRSEDLRRHATPEEARFSFREANPHLAGARPGRLSFEEATASPEKPGTIEVTFSRALTDAELRFFREVCGRTAPLMDGVND